MPKLNTFIDLGSQGFDGAFDEQSRYYFMGLSLKWDLFSSGANTYKIKQAQQDSKINNVQTDYVASQLQLQLVTSEHAFNAAVFNYQFNLSNFGAAQKYYQDIIRLYKSGQALFIELLDAQNQLIQAELQSNISLYETHIKAAEFERASATLNIQSY
ncbi:MAG: TolC family protein [Bacteroidota bacterium]|nr:TolC family protein [Bacteroidota bacterium]